MNRDIRYIVTLIVVAGLSGILWLVLRRDAPEAPRVLRAPEARREAVYSESEQIVLDISETSAAIDEPITFTIRLNNTSPAELSLVKWEEVADKSREPSRTIFLSVAPWTLNLFGIPQTEGFREERIRRLGPGEVNVTEWRGSFREVLNEVGVPVEEQTAREYSVRATLMMVCSGSGEMLFGCNAITSEWIKFQVR